LVNVYIQISHQPKFNDQSDHIFKEHLLFAGPSSEEFWILLFARQR